MKRTIFIFVTLVALLFCNSSAFASNLQPYASLTLSRYFAEATSGENRGEIIIGFEVKSSKSSASLGVENIDFYTRDGAYVTSVSGTTGNGLVRSDSNIHTSNFSYDLPSGNFYYAEVTVFARVGSEYDSRTVTTSTVWVS